MKFLKTAIAAMACLMATAGAFADRMTPAQEKAQRVFYAYLDKEGYNPEVDTTDNSVCFRNRDRVLFWVTFSDTTPMCYTLHRKGFKVGNGREDFKKQPAIIAANEIKGTYPDLNITVTDTKVNIEMKTFASTTQDYTKIFKGCYDKFGSVDEDFKKAYEVAYRSEREARDREDKQIQEMVGRSDLDELIADIAIRAFDNDDQVVADYGKSIRAKQVRYIQFLFEFNPWRQESFETTFFVRITRPNGELITLPGKKYTMELPVEVLKSRKPTEWEAPDLFGSSKEGFWKPGEYKLEILDGLSVIYATEFNIL